MTDAKGILAHIGWGLALTLAANLHTNLPKAAAVALAIAIAKEAAESVWGIWEPKQPWADAAVDTTWFGVGIALAIIIAATS